LFLDGLLGDEQRKTGWMRAEAAGDLGLWRQQAILGRGRCDVDALPDIVRDYIVDTLTAEDAVLVIDEIGFLKQGKTSCSVLHQHTGSAGKITNCRSGSCAAYVSHRGHALIDRPLAASREGDPAHLGQICKGVRRPAQRFNYGLASPSATTSSDTALLIPSRMPAAASRISATSRLAMTSSPSASFSRCDRNRLRVLALSQSKP
jgi:hypothetical protein